MSSRFVNVDRNTPMLLPVDLRDWVPADDLVHFVLEAVDGMRLTTLKVNPRGSGSAQYPPKMMLALLIYCYANGLFSSRRIERATYRDISVRFLTGNTHPDHDTLCTFRRQNFEAMSEAFLQVLQLARAMQVLKVGLISVDGTHIAAQASKDKNIRYDRAGELDQQLQQDIKNLLEQAEETDQKGDDGGQSIPKEIARRELLREKMQQARRDLEARSKARAKTEIADYEEKVQSEISVRDRAKAGRSSRPKTPQTTLIKST